MLKPIQTCRAQIMDQQYTHQVCRTSALHNCFISADFNGICAILLIKLN